MRTNVKERILMANARAVQILIGNSTASFENFFNGYADIHRHSFDDLLKEAQSQKDSKPGSVIHSVQEANEVAAKVMKKNGNRLGCRYADRLSRNKMQIHAMTLELVMATKSLPIEDARRALQTPLALEVQALRLTK